MNKVENFILPLLILILLPSCESNKNISDVITSSSRSVIEVDTLFSHFGQELTNSYKDSLLLNHKFIQFVFDSRKNLVVELKNTITESDKDFILFEYMNMVNNNYSALLFFYDYNEYYVFDYSSSEKNGTHSRYSQIENKNLRSVIYHYGNNIISISEEKQFDLVPLLNNDVENIFIFSKYYDSYPNEAFCKIIYNPFKLKRKLNSILDEKVNTDNSNLHLLSRLILDLESIQLLSPEG